MAQSICSQKIRTRKESRAIQKSHPKQQRTLQQFGRIKWKNFGLLVQRQQNFHWQGTVSWRYFD